MSIPTDSHRELLTVVAHMKAAPGREDELREGLQALIEPTRQEDGCVTYALHESIDDPGVFYFYENWESSEHLEAHLATPHLVALASRTEELLDANGLTITRLRRIA